VSRHRQLHKTWAAAAAAPGPATAAVPTHSPASMGAAALGGKAETTAGPASGNGSCVANTSGAVGESGPKVASRLKDSAPVESVTAAAATRQAART
jgi:hypothetical protein